MVGISIGLFLFCDVSGEVNNCLCLRSSTKTGHMNGFMLFGYVVHSDSLIRAPALTQYEKTPKEKCYLVVWLAHNCQDTDREADLKTVFL